MTLNRYRVSKKCILFVPTWMQFTLDYSSFSCYITTMYKTIRDVIVLRGASGCGKSTFAQLLCDMYYYAIVCEADQYFKVEGKDFHYSLLGKAHEFCREKFRTAIEKNTPVIIVSNTSTREAEISFYIDLAKKNGYKVTSLVVENRNNTKNIHDVPEATLVDQKARLLSSIKL